MTLFSGLGTDIHFSADETGLQWEDYLFELQNAVEWRMVVSTGQDERSGLFLIFQEEEEEEEEEEAKDSSRGRAHRRQRQWYFQSWLRWLSAYAVSPSFVGRPKLLGIMDGMDQNDRINDARRRLRLWHMQRWFCWYCTSGCVPFRCRLAQDAPSPWSCRPW